MKKFTFDLQRFDAVPVADLTALQKAITDATDNAELEVTLTGNIEVSGLNINKLNSLTITPGNYSISGTFTGAKNLTIGSSNVTNTAGVNVAVSNNNVNSITGLSSGAVSYAYNNGTAHTDTYTINASNLMVVDNVVYGVGTGTDLFNLSGSALFNLVGVTTDTGLTYADNKITVANTALTSQTADISINAIKGSATFNYTTPTAQNGDYSWTVSGKVASYQRADYFAKDSAGTTLVYHAQADNNEVVLNFDDANEINSTKIAAITVDTTGKTVTVGKYTEGSEQKIIQSGFTITSGNYTINTPTVGTYSISSPAITKNAGQTSATVTGTLSEGYYLDGNKKLVYTDSQTGYTIATITGLNSTAANTDLTVADTTITLNKNALTNTTVDIKQGYKPDDTTLNNCELALSETAGTAVPLSTTVTESPKWKVSGNTATYRNVTPEYWTLDSTNNQVTYTGEAEGTTLGKITGIVASAPTGGATDVKFAVNDAGNEVIVTYKATADAPALSTQTGVILATQQEGEGKNGYEFAVTENALPTNGASVSLTRPDGSISVLSTDATAQTVETVTTQGSESPKWTFSDTGTIGTATLTAKLTNGYTLTEDGQTIENATAKESATLAKITGLDNTITDWDTAGKYFTVEGTTTSPVVGADTDTNKTITITLKKKALTTGGVSLESNNNSFKYVLALDDDAKAYDATLGNTAQQDKDAWQINADGTTAYWRNITPSYYTLQPNGSITYTPEHVNSTKATITGLKGLVIKDGKLGVNVTTSAGDPPEETTTFTEAVKMDEMDPNTITLNNLALNDTHVRLINGAGSNYRLAMDTAGTDILGSTDGKAEYGIAQSGTAAMWWEVDQGTATLHESLATGYSVENNGLMLKYTEGAEKRTLATVNGLSSDVTVLKTSDGTAFTKLTSGTDDKKDGVALGIADNTTSVVAHKTFNTFDASATPPKVTEWKNTGAQTILLTNAMLDATRVTLRDNYLADTNTFKLDLAAEESGGPKTVPATVTEWETATGVANLVQYRNAYYTKSGDNLINYTKDTTHVAMLELSGLDIPTGVKIEGTTPETAVIKKSDGTTNYISVATDTQTVNVDNAVPASGSITLNAKGTYASYKLTATNPITYADATLTNDENGVVVKHKVKDAGIEISTDGKTATRRDGTYEPTLFTITGLKSKTELAALDVDGNGTADTDEWKNAITYNDTTKTVTLKAPVLSSSSTKPTIQLTPEVSTDKYKLALDPTVPQKPTTGFSWDTSTAGTLKGNKARMEFFTKNNDTTITHNAETTISELFTITGLNDANIVPAKGTADKDGNYIFGNNILTIDETSRTVTINESAADDATALPASLIDGTTKIQITNNWKLAAITEPVFANAITASNWDITDIAHGKATLKLTASSPGWLRSKDGSTLTYVDNDKAHEFLTISGLKTSTTAAQLVNAFDAGTKTVTLPKEVIAEGNLSITSKDFIPGETYALKLDSEVLQTTGTKGNAWEITTIKDAAGEDTGLRDVAYKAVRRACYIPTTRTNGVVTGYTYIGEQDIVGQPLFKLTGLKAEKLNAFATTPDKDGNTSLDKDAVTQLISVSGNNVTLHKDILPSGNDKNGAEVKLSGGSYVLVDNFQAPEYSTPEWVHDNDSATLKFEASQDGYNLSADKRTLKYVGQMELDGTTKVKHPFLKVTGIKDPIGTDLPTDAYDVSTKTVTLPNSALARTDGGYVRLFSENGDTYTLAMDTVLDPVRTTAQDGFAWDVTIGDAEDTTDTLTAKSVTMDWYEARGTNNYYYHSQTQGTPLFTITGLAKDKIPTTIVDKDGDNILVNDTDKKEYISFNTANNKVTILNKDALPTTDTFTVKISGGQYTFDTTMSDFQTPTYNSNDASWTLNTSSDTATLSITPKKAGYEVSSDNKTLTYVGASLHNLMELSGLAGTLTAAQLKAGIDVDVDTKTLTVYNSVLKGTTLVTADSGYTLALGSDVQDTQPTNAEPMWVIDSGVAYYRKAKGAYYTANPNKTAIQYHEPEKVGNDLLVFSGLKTSGLEVNDNGDIVESTAKTTPLITLSEPLETGGKNIVLVNTAAIADAGTLTMADGYDASYKFALSNNEATILTPSYEYDGNAGTVTVKATFTEGKFIVSADGKTITKITNDNKVKTLATIRGLNTGLTFADSNAIAAKFIFDSYAKTLTFKDESLIEGKTVTIDSDEFGFKLGLDSSINTATDSTESKWFTKTNGDIEYKQVTLAHYGLNATSDIITYTPDTAGTSAATATISGLKSGLKWKEGTTAGSFSIVDDEGTVTTADAVSISGNVITLKKEALPTGNETATVTLESSSHTLALDPTATATDIPTTSEQSEFKWNQVAGANIATITAKTSEKYEMASGNQSITYTPPESETTLATISGIAKLDEDMTGEPLESATMTDPIAKGVYVDTYDKTIYFSDSALTNANVSFDDNAGGFKFALLDAQNTTAADIWSYADNTATYKNATPAHYTLTDQTHITYNEEKTNNKYFTITGLKPDLTADTSHVGGITFDGNNTVTVTAADLPVPTDNAEVIVRITEGYSLSLGTMENSVIDGEGKVTTYGKAAEDTTEKDFSLSGNDVIYTAPIKAGYTIVDGVIKYVDGVDDTKKYFTISGLDIPAGTTNFTDYLRVDGNTITVKAAALKEVDGSEVTITANDGGTYALALDSGVKQAKDAVSGDNWVKVGGENYAFKQGITPAYYTLSENKITCTAATDGTTLVTVSGLNNPDNTTAKVNPNSKVITLTSDALGTSGVEIVNGDTSEYTLALSGVTAPTDEKKWTVKDGVATLTSKPSSDGYTLDADAKSVTYTSADSQSETLISISGLGLSNVEDAPSVEGITVTPGGEGEPTTIELGTAAFGNSDVKLTGGASKANYQIEIANDATIKKSEVDTTNTADWDYAVESNKPTFTFKRTTPYYVVNANGDEIKYYAPGNYYLKIAGNAATDFADSIKTKIEAYNTAAAGDKATAKTNLIIEFKKYVNTTTTPSADGVGAITKGKVTISKGSESNAYINATDKQLTVTTFGNLYEVGLSETISAQNKTWTVNGNNLVLASPLTKGYKLKNNILTSSAEDGQETVTIATISGLNLTEAKAEMDDAEAELADGATDQQKATARQTALTTYLSGKLEIDDETNTIKIGEGLLGASNVSITNGADTAYKIDVADAVLSSAAEARAAANPVWTVSGSTAYYKNNTPAYYVTNAAGTQIAYNRPVVGSTLITLRGLRSSKVVDNTTDNTTDTYVLAANAEGQIGFNVTQRDAEGKVVGTPEFTPFSSGAGVELVEVTKDDKDTTLANPYTDVIIHNEVLGTSNVTYTGTSAYKLKLDENEEKVPAPKRTEETWVGSVGGTSAVLRANYQEGYTQNGNTITHTAARNNVTLATINGIKIGATAVTSATAALEAAITAGTETRTGDELEAARATAKAADATATANAVHDWINSRIDKGDLDDNKITFTIKSSDVFDNKDITVRSGDRKTYYLELESKGEGAEDKLKETEAAKAKPGTREYSWNGLTYQSATADYYTSGTNSSTIKYTKPGSITRLATVRGIKSNLNLNNITKATDGGSEWVASTAGGKLIIGNDLINNSDISVSLNSAATNGITGFDIDLELATGENITIPTAEVAYGSAAWTISGTSASLRGGGTKPYYTATTSGDPGKDTIKYHGESAVQTYATLRGLSTDATMESAVTFTDSGDKRKVKLSSDAIGPSTITLTKGNVAADTLTYELDVPATLAASGISNSVWKVSGANATVAGGVSEGWELTLNKLTLQYTPASTNKQLATLVFDKAGVITDGVDADVNGNVVTLGDLGESNRVTFKTNPGAMTFKFTKFNGEAGTGEDPATRKAVVGSAVADSVEFANAESEGTNYVAVSGMAGNDHIDFKDATDGVSVSGGAGHDTIKIADGAVNITVYGDADHDSVIVGNIGADNERSIFYGGVGNDTITVGAIGDGGVSLRGDAGNDYLEVGGSAFVYGGNDNDTIKIAAPGAVQVLGEAGNDHITVTGAATGSTLNGGAGNDTISLSGGLTTVAVGENNVAGVLLGEAGDDRITVTGAVTGGDDVIITINGGAGNDVLDFENAVTSARVMGDAGNDSISIAGAISKVTISAGANDDKITLGAVSGSSIMGEVGNDAITVTGAITGAEDNLTHINVGAGNDIVDIKDNAAFVKITLDAGDDKVTLGSAVSNVISNVTLDAGAGNDNISVVGTLSLITISAGANNDIINLGDANTAVGLSGGGKIAGEAGDDRITVTGTITGGTGDGIITIDGGVGNDIIDLKANVEKAVIKADAGNDNITIGGTAKNVTIDAGAGVDNISIHGNAENLTIDSGAGNDNITLNGEFKTGGKIDAQANDDRIVVVGAITGGTGDGIITIDAGIGNDNIDIRDNVENARIVGDAGNDNITIGGAEKTVKNTTIEGGAGLDNITIGSAATDISVLGGDANDKIIFVSGSGTIEGGTGNDVISIGSGANGVVAKGDAGNDVMTFVGGTGTVEGGDGNDVINITNASGVTVDGGTGNDRITFTAGTGEVIGGAGNDSIDLGSGAVTYTYSGGNDSIRNFTAGTDKFVIDGAAELTSATLKGTNVLLTIGAGRVTLFGAGTAGADSFVLNTTKTLTFNEKGVYVPEAEAGDIANDINSLIYEDNNLMTPNDISDLVKTNSVTEYNLGGLNIDKPNDLLAQGDILTYSAEHKKNNK